MKQLPGQGRPRWLQQLLGFGATLLVTVWLVSLLPVLLIVGLVAGLALVPLLRQLRRELEKMDDVVQRPGIGPPASSMRDATPWHQKLRNHLRL